MISSAFDWYVQHVLNVAGCVVSTTPEPENAGYGASMANIDGQRWRVRTARVTPTKAGAFVSVWRRSAGGGTEPFPASEGVHGLLVFVLDQDRRGLFRFTSAHLRDLGVASADGCSGKRGFRVYPEWSEGLNAQARRTQRAQAAAFSRL